MVTYAPPPNTGAKVKAISLLYVVDDFKRVFHCLLTDHVPSRRVKFRIYRNFVCLIVAGPDLIHAFGVKVVTMIFYPCRECSLSVVSLYSGGLADRHWSRQCTVHTVRSSVLNPRQYAGPHDIPASSRKRSPARAYGDRRNKSLITDITVPSPQ